MPERRLEESDPCPQPWCDGTLKIVRPDDCSCHLSPPCDACVYRGMPCSECGWTTEDNIDEPAPVVPAAQPDVPRLIADAWMAGFLAACRAVRP